MSEQLPLFGRGAPRIDPELREVRRLDLGAGAWVDYAPAWLEGQARVFDEIARDAPWRAQRRVMYEREVDVPRLVAGLEPGTGPPIVSEIASALSRRYRRDLCHIGLAYYRGGRDSVAWHRDKVLRDMPTAVVAIVSLGAPRRFLLRPLGGGRRAIRLSPGHGDLVVMGGTTQRTWEHCVPKTQDAGPRISVMFRHAAPDGGGR